MQNDKAPERIWISLWEDEDLHPLDQKLNDEDVEYIRADLVEAKVKAVQVKLDAEQQYIKSLHRDIRELRKLAGLYEGEEK